MAKKFKPGEVKELKKNQYVLDVAPDRLVLTLPFRQRLFDEWCQKPETVQLNKYWNKREFHFEVRYG